MSNAARTPATDLVDVLGLGFGPSGMALAVAVEEHNRDAAPEDRIDAVFHERRPESAWHPGMLFEDAHMQVAFVKDLVTMRNPSSDFGFLSFLQESGRLVDFVNRGSMTPLRVEFAAYLRWAAARLDAYVRYGSSVRAVTPVRDAGRVVAFDVTTEAPDAAGRPLRRVTRARDVVVAAGLQPHLPDGTAESARVWHNHAYLDRVAALDVAPRRVVVVGAGQSAAEVLVDLYDRFPGAEVHSVSRRFGFRPADSSPFANQVFDPESVDHFFDAPAATRDRLLDQYRDTNYSVVADRTIRELFERGYRDRWLDRERLHWHRATEVLAVDDHGGTDGTGAGVRVSVVEGLTGTASALDVDLVVLATGYRPLDPTTLLGPTEAGLVARDEAGRVLVQRDHVAELTEPADARLYLVGQSEHLHGLSTTLLSAVGVRAGELLESLVRGSGVRALGVDG